MWDRLSFKQQDVEQGRLLAEWVEREVRPFSSFWRDRLGAGRIRSPHDLRGVTTVTEADVAGAGGPGNPALLILPTEGGFKRHASRRDVFAAAREAGGRGAAGRRAALFRRYKPIHVHEAGAARLVAIAYSRSDLDRLHLAGARLMQVLGLGADDALVSAVPASPSLSFWGLYHAALAARMTALHPRSAGQDALRPILRGIALLPPTVLALPGDEALSIMDGLIQQGAVLNRLRTLLTVGPPPSVGARQALTELASRVGAAGVRVQAVWAPESARALWGECRPPSGDPTEARYGLHTYPDMDVLEIRDVATGNRQDEREPGELVLTSLGWRGTALLRYATGAYSGGLITKTPCPACGRTVPRLAPEARDAAWQPPIRTADGRRVRADLRGAPGALSSAALAQAGVRAWTLATTGQRLLLTVDGGDPAALERLAAAVGHAVGVVPNVHVDPARAGAGLQVAPHD